jgi:hypothetical protein
MYIYIYMYHLYISTILPGVGRDLHRNKYTNVYVYMCVHVSMFSYAHIYMHYYLYISTILPGVGRDLYKAEDPPLPRYVYEVFVLIRIEEFLEKYTVLI